VSIETPSLDEARVREEGDRIIYVSNIRLSFCLSCLYTDATQRACSKGVNHELEHGWRFCVDAH
jgi:hypothetical protein